MKDMRNEAPVRLLPLAMIYVVSTMAALAVEGRWTFRPEVRDVPEAEAAPPLERLGNPLSPRADNTAGDAGAPES